MLTALKSWLSLAIVVVLCCAVCADNWPQWRGPNSDGVAPGEGFPTKWSDTDNVVWKVALPGWGTSTPAVWEERIFVTCQDEGKNVLMCLNRGGQTLWTTSFGAERTARNRKASGSNPSPVTDGKHVYVYFKSGDLACVDFAGETIWSTNLQEEYGEDTLWWDLGTSPVLMENLLIVTCLQTGPSYLLALDKSSGEVVWKQERRTSARSESAQSYTTPLPITGKGDSRVAILGADTVTMHDLTTGKELWRVGGLNPRQRTNYRSISSPVLSNDLLIAPYQRGSSLTAIRLGGSGDVTDSHVVWESEFAADVPTPIVWEGRIYICGDRGDVSCLNGTTGELIWSQRVESNRYAYSSSPVIADGRLYVTREDGVTFVLGTGDEYQLLEKNGIYEYILATPVFVDGQALIRTAEHLYCIGKP